MEMILRQFEAMEKAEQRKRDHTDHPGSAGATEGGGPVSTAKRRRSSSAKTTGRSNSLVDSNVEASSAEDEARPEQPKRSLKKKGKKGAPQRRRSRIMSGESVSAASESEIVPPSSAEYGSATPNTATSTSNGPFRYTDCISY